jgi:cation:H+ antiporter
MTISSFILGGSIEKLKTRFSLSGGLLGMITALAANTPEISSAVTALFSGQHDVGVGIIIGSSIFNLAALLGVSALIAGRLIVKRQGVIFNGAASLMVILVMVLLVFRFITAPVSLMLIMLLLILYIGISSLKPDFIKQWGLSDKIYAFLITVIAQTRHASREPKTAISKSWSWVWMGGLAVIVIIAASIGMVRSAVFLSNAWGVSTTIVGMVILAALTGIPNVITSIKLALRGNGTAVMSESLNSNTLNILFGICVPAAILNFAPLSGQNIFSVWWLAGTTITALVLLYFNKGLNRLCGTIVVGSYLVFVVLMIGWK